MRERDRRTLQEAERIKLRTYVTEELGDTVDYWTGEIMEGRDYTTHPPSKIRNEAGTAFSDIVSHPQMEMFMSQKDRRRLKLFNNCRAIYDMDKGRACLEKSSATMSASTMEKMNRLINRLDYRNVIVARPREISHVLGIDHRNLYKHLRSLKGLVDWSGPSQGIKQGSVRVEVCPSYGFRYEAYLLDSAREKAVKAWYLTRCRSLSDGGAVAMEAMPYRDIDEEKKELAS